MQSSSSPSSTVADTSFLVRNHRGISVLLLVLSIVGIFFLVEPEYADFTDTSTVLERAKAELDSKTQDLEKLNAIQSKLALSGAVSEIERYAGDFREDIIMESIFGVRGRIPVGISTFSMSPGTRLPNGLSLGTVSLGVTAPDLATLVRYLDYLTGTDGTRRYIVRNLSLPYDRERKDPISVSLSLGVYYLGNQ